MVQSGTILKIVDKTSVVLGRCIKVFGPTRKRLAKLGDVVLVSVRWLNAKKVRLLKPRLRKRFGLGTLHRALVVRVKFNYCRFPGGYIRFDENAAVLVNKKVVPVSNRVYGPILKELCMKWPSLGCVSRCIV
jgi:large subunit ribosomal protein L14